MRFILVQHAIIFAGNFPVFLSNSSFNLLDDINAISTLKSRGQ